MNYDGFVQLCKDNGTTPTALTQKLGLSKGNTSSWKKGGNPSVDVLVQLSVELNCTTDYLLGLTPKSTPAKTSLDVDFQNKKIPEDLLPLISQLDNEDLIELRGTVKQMLRAEKYKQEALKQA